MKLIVSSDKKTIVNAESVSKFFVFEHADGHWSIWADQKILSNHKDCNVAKKQLKKLSISLAQDNLPLLYQMEDTD